MKDQPYRIGTNEGKRESACIRPEIRDDRRMARIGIHATALEPGRTGGAETYMRELLGAPAFRQALAGHDVRVFVGYPVDPALAACGFELVRCPVDPRRRNARVLWDQYALPRLLRQHRLDLVHFPYSSICRTYDGPQVVTVHDTTNFIMPASVARTERIYRRWLQSALASNTRCQVIAVSDTDRRVFLEHLRLPEARARTVYHGKPLGFACPAESVGKPRPGGDLLWVGRPYHHKNVALLFALMSELRGLRGARVPRLRMIGIDGPSRVSLSAEARRMGVEDLIQMEPPLPHAMLPAAFASAALFVFPSRYESFGMPPLEAQCCGTPVVAADLPILREILGAGALYASPDDPKAFAANCNLLLDDRDAWAQQAQRGVALAARYSWERCARETAGVFEETLARFMRP